MANKKRTITIVNVLFLITGILFSCQINEEA